MAASSLPTRDLLPWPAVRTSEKNRFMSDRNAAFKIAETPGIRHSAGTMTTTTGTKGMKLSEINWRAEVDDYLAKAIIIGTIFLGLCSLALA